MLLNPIAILLFRPARAVVLALAVLAGYGSAALFSFELDEQPVSDASDVSRVELLR